MDFDSPFPLRFSMTFLLTVLFSLTLLAAPSVRAAQDDGLTLRAARSLSYQADEATWMQPDLSPDGRTILFDLLGDIYALDRKGGEARPLLTGMAFERNPVFSPDGSKIAFISDRSGVTNLWIANADGSDPRQISHDSSLVLYTSPAWAPDGRALYVSRMVHAVLAFELVKYPLGDGEPETIVAAQPNGEDWDNRINALGAAISPDGKYAYYATKRGHTWTENDLPDWHIARRDLAAGTDEKVVDSAGGAMRPAVSHDGRYLAYASRWQQQTGIRLRNLITGEDKWIAFPVDHDGQQGGYYADLLPRFSFTPDDSALLASVDGGIRLIGLDGDSTEIVFNAPVHIGIGPATRVQQTEETGPVKVRVIQAPRLSPDGNRLAYTALGGLYVQDIAAGTAPRRIVDNDAFQPAWSPDGTHIAYVTWNAMDAGHVWTVAADGSTPARHSQSPAVYSEPVYSADGQTVHVLRANHHDRMRALTEISPARPTDILSIDLASGAQTRMAHLPSARALQRTDDGMLWFLGPKGLTSLDPETGKVTPRVSFTARPMGQYIKGRAPVQDIRISPDGRYIIASSAAQLYLHGMPPADGDDIVTRDIDDDEAVLARLTRIGADFVAWSPDGHTVTWSVGSQFRAVPLAKLTGENASVAEQVAMRIDMPVNLPRDVPTGMLLLRGATLFPMDSRASNAVIERGDILVQGNRIAAIGRTGTLNVPKGTPVRNMRGRFIIPGLVDTHAHFFAVRRGLHDAAHWEFPANLAYGVTSALEVQPFTTDIFAYQDMIDAGMMVGPRAWSTGPGIFVNSEIHSRQDAIDVLSRYRDHYRTRNIKSYMIGGRAERQFMVEASAELGMMPTTEGASDLVLGLTHAIDGFAGNEHTLPVTPLRSDVVRLIAASGMSYNPTLSVLYGGGPALFDYIIKQRPQDDPRFTHFVPPGVVSDKLRNRHWMPAEAQSYDLFARDALNVQRAGGLVGMGSHGEMQGLGMHWEMQAFASGGASAMEVLRAATIDAATIIGHEPDVGSITAGKFADLVILDADPREDIRNTRTIAAVMKNGRLYDPDTLASHWPDERPAPPRWFAHEAPPAISQHGDSTP